MRNFLWLFFVTGLFQVFASTVMAESPPRIISPRLEFPLNAHHLSTRPEQVRQMDEGSLSVRTNFLWANTFLLEPNYVVDVEHRTVETELRYGALPNLDLRVSVPVTWTGGGSLDHIIRSWHEWFSLPEGNRESVEDDQYQVGGTLSDDGSFGWDKSGTELGNVVLGARTPLLTDDLEIGFMGSVSLPTGTGSYTHRGFDTHAQIDAAIRWEKWELFSGLSVIWIGDDTHYAVKYRRLRPEGFIGASVELRPRVWATAILTAGEQPVENVRTFPDQFIYLDVGVAFAVGSDLTLSIGLRENPWPGDGTTDVAGLLGIEWRP